MSRLNVHAAYIIGILTALLVGTLAVKWNTIKDLPGIIAFALSFASLLLAVLAIFQSATSSSALTGLLTSLERISGTIQKSAVDVGSAAESVIATTQTHTSALSDFRDTVVNRLTHAEEEQTGGSKTSVTKRPSFMRLAENNTYGAKLAVYLLSRSVESNASVRGKDVIDDNSILSNYIDGYIQGLISTSFINGKNTSGRFVVDDIHADPADVRAHIRDWFERQPKTASNGLRRLQMIDDYFDNLAPPA